MVSAAPAGVDGAAGALIAALTSLPVTRFALCDPLASSLFLSVARLR
jgi:hypothetical protein